MRRSRARREAWYTQEGKDDYLERQLKWFIRILLLAALAVVALQLR